MLFTKSSFYAYGSCVFHDFIVYSFMFCDSVRRTQVSAELDAFARNAPPLHATAAAYYPHLSLPLASASASASSGTGSGKAASAAAAAAKSASGASVSGGAEGAAAPLSAAALRLLAAQSLELAAEMASFEVRSLFMFCLHHLLEIAFPKCVRCCIFDGLDASTFHIFEFCSVYILDCAIDSCLHSFCLSTTFCTSTANQARRGHHWHGQIRRHGCCHWHCCLWWQWRGCIVVLFVFVRCRHPTDDRQHSRYAHRLCLIQKSLLIESKLVRAVVF